MAPKKIAKALTKIFTYYSRKMNAVRLVCVVVDVDGDEAGNSYVHHNFADRKQLLITLIATAKMEMDKHGTSDLGIDTRKLAAVLEAIEDAGQEGHTVH